jgi:hypothetical protein
MSKLSDATALQVEALWKAAFSDATLFPGIGLPSQDKGVLFLTHSLQLGTLLKIDQLPSISPISNNSLYSAENINSKTFNIYEVLVPDIPGVNGGDSTGQVYIRALIANGLIPAGNHFHWTGQYFFNGEVRDHNVAAIHHQQYNMDPVTFTNKTIAALKVLVAEIKKRVGPINHDVQENKRQVETCNPDDNTCGINDELAESINNKWKKYYPDSFILPVIGFPSYNNNKLAIFSHSLSMPPMMVNGLPVQSPLANNAIYTFECTRGKFLNLYEIMLPDIVGKPGSPSTVQIYVNALRDNGLDVAGVHWHFWGGVADPEDRGVFAIHHQNVGMHPREFTKATIKALEKALCYVNHRTNHESLNRKNN